MPSPEPIFSQERLTQALQHQRQLAERETRRQEEINRLREAMNLGGQFIAEWEAQSRDEPSVTQLRSKYEKTGKLEDETKAEIMRARGVEYLRTLASKVKAAMATAGKL